ncbi:MAG TPA: hypothetical protein DD723_04460 [Candidatus Omnitrophica bacterium]|nr:MAG: hypothetical protein A2Z81_03960 [Omnitrophica WOR_2 bacterium GWA2_45_18]OGX20365.1 MAG: hypothetical protein A2Y04_05015 [Omnitrophica WOR_2 bacterium GWC2_45_7]HBR14782.1 hypothetical protein [Candidatus Omnitrophota bacterium]
MTRDEIYDHLAQVYLGKRKKADEIKNRQFNAWLVINLLITFVIFVSAYYGLTAFLTQRKSTLQNSVIFTLNQGVLRLEYDFQDDFPPVKSLALSIPSIDGAKYNKINFSLRGKEEGIPGVVKVVFRNQKNETASYYVQGIGPHWKEFSIPLKEFHPISDWTNLIDISFVLESWNVDKQKGMILIDSVCFST